MRLNLLMNMRSKKNGSSKINRILGIPDEVTTSVPRIVSLGFKKVWIENYKSVLEYQDVLVRLSTSIGIININGLELKRKH